MTMFFTPGGGGIGGSPSPTSDTRALQDINSRNKTFTNKDFVKNLAWLNNSVDTLSVWSQKLQQGVDQANQSAIDQIQGVFADLFVMFAGMEPTGFEFGDLKYVIQGLGAMLGINPDTPFPFNLVEGVTHLFDTYIMPLPQLTDVVLDTVQAWAEELGFTDEAVDSIEEFSNAIVITYQDWNDVSIGMQQGLIDLFRELGLGSNFLSLNWIADLWGDLITSFMDFTAQPRQMLMGALSQIVVLLFRGLTGIVRMIDPYTIITALGLDSIGPQLAIPVSNDIQDWFLDTDPETGWVFDVAHSHGGSAGSFKTSGSANNKVLMPQDRSTCGPDDILIVSGFIAWDGIPEGVNSLGLQMDWLNDAAPVSSYNINLPSGHGATGGWLQIGERLAVPPGVNGYRLGCRVNYQVTTGDVWVDDLSVTKQSNMGIGINNFLRLFLPSNIWQNFLNTILSIEGATWQMVAEFIRDLQSLGNFVQKVLGGGATLDDLAAFVRGLFGPFNPPSMVGVGQIANTAQNLILNPIFETAQSLVGEAIWAWDTASHAVIGGSATIDAAINGTAKTLLSNPILTALGDQIEASTWVKWDSLSHTGDGPISLMLNLYNSADELIGEVELQAAEIAGATSDWVQLTGNHIVDDIQTAYARLNFNVSELATAGQVWFDDVVLHKPAATLTLPSTNILNDLGGATGTVASALQGTVDAAAQGFNGLAAGVGNSLEQLSTGIGYAINTWLGFNGTPIPSTGSITHTLTSNIANRAVSKPSYQALDPSSDPVFDISKLLSTTPLPTVPVTEGISAIGFIGTPDAGLKDGIAWLGYPTGGNMNNISRFYLNVYQMTPSTGDLTFLWTSGDIHGDIPGTSSPDWVFFDIPDELDIVTAQGNWYAIELVIVGSGTYNLLGVVATIPAHPHAYPSMLGARRTGLTPSGGDQSTPPSTISNTLWTVNTPWFALSGTAGETQYPPVLYTFYQGDGQTFDIPDWANNFDIIPFAGGGGGVNGAYLVGGFAGNAGGYTAISLQRGVDFPSDTETMTVNVGGGGGPGPAGGTAGSGGASSVEIDGYSSGPIVVGGGAGGVGNVSGAYGAAGGGGGYITINGNTYYQGGPQGSPQGNGNPPGGGGAGGNAGWVGSFIGGGFGAAGIVFILASP